MKNIIYNLIGYTGITGLSLLATAVFLGVL